MGRNPLSSHHRLQCLRFVCQISFPKLSVSTNVRIWAKTLDRSETTLEKSVLGALILVPPVEDDDSYGKDFTTVEAVEIAGLFVCHSRITCGLWDWLITPFCKMRTFADITEWVLGTVRDFPIRLNVALSLVRNPGRNWRAGVRECWGTDRSKMRNKVN